jgi:hypothetical protein
LSNSSQATRHYINTNASSISKTFSVEKKRY